MDARHKIKKIFFISGDRKGIVREDKIFILDAKDQVIKEFIGKNCDLLKIKHQPMIAYVQHQFLLPRDPHARRNALLRGDELLPGKTTFFHVDKLDEPFLTLNCALTQAILLDQKIIGLSGLEIISHHLKKNTGEIYSAWFLEPSVDCIPVLEHFFVIAQGKNSSRMLFERDDGDNVQGVGVAGVFNLSSACALENKDFLVQAKNGDLEIHRILSLRKIELLKKKNSVDVFKDLLLMPGNKTVLGRDIKDHLFLIDVKSLHTKKLPFKLTQPILELAVCEKENIIALLADGSYCNIGELILKHSHLHHTLHQNTTFPTVLINMIVNYEASYAHFFEPYHKKTEEKPEFYKRNVL